MKKDKTYHKIIISIVAAAAVLLLCCLFINRPDNTYDFPMVSQTLKWGSSKEDIIAETNARPEYLYHEINSTQVFYTDKKIETVFGTSSETRFFIITDFSVPVGLYGVQFTFADYSLEETKEAVFKQYKDIGHSVKWDASGSTTTTFYYPESSRFIYMDDSQWNIIYDYYSKLSIDSTLEEQEYKLDKMRNNDYFFMIQITEPNVIFINALPLAILSMEKGK